LGSGFRGRAGAERERNDGKNEMVSKQESIQLGFLWGRLWHG
jgi:hypothetical protein